MHGWGRISGTPIFPRWDELNAEGKKGTEEKSHCKENEYILKKYPSLSEMIVLDLKRAKEKEKTKEKR